MNYGKYGTRKRQRALTSKTTKLKKMILVTMLKALLVCFITCIVLGISLAIGMFRGILDSTPDITIEDVIPSGYASVVYDSEGHEMVKLVEEGSNRTPVTMDLIPDDLAHAFIAIEDARFYQHNGIDIKGIMRAAFNGMRNGFHFNSGASTITQQLLKNNVFDGWVTERTFIESLKRKIQEQYLAIQLEKVMGKDQILEYYLNTINLGHSTLGVQAASMRYFNKPVYELNLSECAVIAAITQNPSRYDPIVYPEYNAERRADVLEHMLEQGWINQAEYDEAMADDVYSRIQIVNQAVMDSSINSYFEDALVAQLEADLIAAGYSSTQAKNLMYSGGLSIYSTQDSAIQAIADEVCSNPENYPENVKYELSYQLTVQLSDGTYQNYSSEMFAAYFKESDRNFKMLYSSEEDAYADIEEYKAYVMGPRDEFVSESITLTPQPQISMTIIDQHTGHVLAMVGGRGQKEGSRTLNRAYSVRRQPGSTFKIIAAYAPAIDTGAKTLASVYNDAPFNYDDGTPVQNYDRQYHGLLSVRDGILGSINVLAVKTITEITPALGFNYARNFGFSTLTESEVSSDGTKILSDVTQSLALGGLTTGAKNYELCAAYAAIANNGTYIEPILYTKVVDSHGNVILDNTVNQESHQVIKETTAFLLTSAMQDVVTGGGSGIVTPTGTAANFSGQAIAGKTGTSTAYRDVWFAGFTPYYTCAVWTGYDNRNSTTFLSGNEERNLSKKLWRLVMTQLHENLPYQAFTMPSGIATCTVCSRSGKLPIEGLCDAHLTTEYFENGTQPTELCDVHYSGSVCCVDVLPATEQCPFQYPGILELIPVEHESLLKGSAVVNGDGTVTTASTTNMCQHTPEFFAQPDVDALLLQQWAAILPEQRQAILDLSPSDYFRNLFGYGELTTPTTPDGSEVVPIQPPDPTALPEGGGSIGAAGAAGATDAAGGAGTGGSENNAGGAGNDAGGAGNDAGGAGNGAGGAGNGAGGANGADTGTGNAGGAAGGATGGAGAVGN